MLELFQQELASQGRTSFYVRALPGASKTELVEQLSDGSVKIRIAAPAEEGKANTELIRFLANEFRVQKSQVEIVSGKTGRMKLIRIRVS